MRRIFATIICLIPLLSCSQGTFQKHFANAQAAESKGYVTKAVTYYLKAENVAKKAYEKNRVYKALADNYKAISDYNHAIDYYTKLQNIYNADNRNRVTLNLSDLWILTGQYQKVVDNLKDMRNAPDEDVRITNLASAYAKLGQYNQAIALLNQVIAIGDKKHLKIALQNKGYVLWAQGNLSEADSALQKAVNMFDNGDKNRYICLANLAKVQSALQRYDDAINNINNAIEWQKTHLGEKHFDYIISLRKKAEILLEAGRSGDAVKGFRDFFYREREYVIKNFAYMTENERLNFWHSQKPLIDQCFALEAADPDFLFDVAVFSKSVLNQANINIAEAAFANKELSEIYSKITAAKSELISSTAQERIAIQSKIDNLEKQLSANMPSFRRFVSSLETDSKKIRQCLLNQHEAVVEFIYYQKEGKMRYAALLLQKTGNVKFVPLFTQTEIESYPLDSMGLPLAQCIMSHDNTLKRKLFTDTLLANKIWGEITSPLPYDTDLYFVPDGIFYNYAIEYLPCRQDIRIMRLSSSNQLCRQPKRRHSSAMLIGGLDYFDVSNVRPYSDTIPDRYASRVLNGSGKSYTWTPLKYSRREIDSVEAVFRAVGINTRKISQGKGTEAFIKRNAIDAEILLISTHGYTLQQPKVTNSYNMTDIFSADSSMSMCGLVLSGANITSKNTPDNILKEDGYLSGFEISGMDFSHNDLTVLSACQTGLGGVSLDGAPGLVRGLKKAGANSLVVSLWEVSDLATGLFMTFFFQAYNQGMSKYDALKTAQNQLINYHKPFKIKTSEFSQNRQANVTVFKEHIPDFSDPFYWAAFILIDGI